MAANPEKLRLAKKILIILGIVVIIMGFLLESLIQPFISMMPAETYDMFLENILALTIFAVIVGILYIVGAIMLEKDEKKAKLLVLILSIISIKDAGFIGLIVYFVLLKNEEQ